MANNFKVWVDNGSSSNLPDQNSFNNASSDRGVGFRPSTAASSQFVNAGLRQANLFTTAFMQMMEDAGVDTSSIDFTSSVANLETLLQNFCQKKLIYRHVICIKLKRQSDFFKEQRMSFEFLSNSNESIFLPTDTNTNRINRLFNILITKYYGSTNQPDQYLSCNSYCYYNQSNVNIIGIYAYTGSGDAVKVLYREINSNSIDYNAVGLSALLDTDVDIAITDNVYSL